jgi:hypothetical protein
VFLNSDGSWNELRSLLDLNSEDVVEGEGPEAREGDLVQFNYVCRRANGYFVHRCVVEFPDRRHSVAVRRVQWYPVVSV